ncbi:BNR repeat-containing protein [Cnuella takakiae]|nr:BNR repeat-containing protein [Cnuella takakiae]OLY90667.1 neuraminidase [Cnuella takakiae]
MVISTGAQKVRLVPVAEGWSANTVNVTVFRKNALASYKDTQYIAFYNPDSYVVVGKRRIGGQQWQVVQTPFKGNTRDAHNIISIMTDGAGYLHMAWDHHNNPLHYTRSIAPGALQFEQPQPMTGTSEAKVSYPEFYRLPQGDLLFLYRDGGSGNGNLVMNRYDLQTGRWQQVQHNLISGEGKRNPYWQACVDSRGTIHLSWVWRESPDVASNHDLCYARSTDGGISWERSDGQAYRLPITAASAEYAWRIPQQSELINQTSMFADEKGQPYIATYWRDSTSSVPQYRMVFSREGVWQMQNLGFRALPFSLSGAGSKAIPIARPQIIAWRRGSKWAAGLVFRDAERGSRISIAVNKNLRQKKWKIRDLATDAVGNWEPSYDTELWKEKRLLHLFMQPAIQVDGEGVGTMKPQMVQVLEYRVRK